MNAPKDHGSVRLARAVFAAAGLLLTQAAAASNVDVAIAIDDGHSFVNGDGTSQYTVVVDNAGPDAVEQGTVTVTMPASVSRSVWTCSSAGGVPCAVPQGSGALSQSVNIAAHEAIVYLVTATIKATPEHDLIVNARVRVHGTQVDVASTDNNAMDIDTVGIFADAFEGTP